MEVITEDGFDMFNVQRVLDEADVSRATLYRYFTDVDSLIEAALVATYAQEMTVNVRLFAELVEQHEDRPSFREAVRSHIELQSQLPAVVRFRRAHTLALCATRPLLAAMIVTEQDALTSGIEDAVTEAIRRGFFRDDVDVQALAQIVQAIPFGRIVGDVATSQLDNDRWAAAYFDLIDRAYLAHDD